MGNATSPPIPQDGRELLSLCRTGRLYDIEKWIAAGKPLDIAAAKRKTLLQITVDTEFHSMYFSSKGEMKWISLMLWTGADARAKGPSLDEMNPTDPDCYVSAMQEACYAGNVEVLKKLKPEAGRDDLEDLLHSVAISGRRDAIRYLLSLGQSLTTKKMVARRRLDMCIWHLGFPSFNHYGFKLRSKCLVPNQQQDNI